MPHKILQPASSATTIRRPSASTKASAAVKLPKPRLSGGKSLAESLGCRQTIREISSKKLPLQLLSNLLWAACGINRPTGPFGVPGITAASASSSQEIDLYVALREGIYLFDPSYHRLVPVVAGDLRTLAIGRGQRDLAIDAPVQLIYVVDVHRLSHTAGFQEPGLQDPEVQRSYYYVDTGLIAGNVYLFAASQGLACWFHNCDRSGLARKLRLSREQRVLFAQTVGYPEQGKSGAPK